MRTDLATNSSKFEMPVAPSRVLEAKMAQKGTNMFVHACACNDVTSQIARTSQSNYYDRPHYNASNPTRPTGDHLDLLCLLLF